MNLRKPIPEQHRCIICGEKWKQSALGLCRECERLTRGEEPGARATTVTKKKEKVVQVFNADHPMPPLERVIDGQVYAVVWNGSRPYNSLEFIQFAPR